MRMNILVTGASGFIASEIVTDLLNTGHTVTCCVRNTTATQRRFPSANVIACNFITDTTSEIWINRLTGIDVVINCVGILYHPDKKIIWAIHYDTPVALFDAAMRAGIKKIITISALGVETSTLEYAASKKAADDYLLKLPLTAIVLRPSVVYGKSSYGGTSLFRGLAGLPCIIPLPGNGTQELQPIHVEDLAKAVRTLVNKKAFTSCILQASGPKRITLKDTLSTIRAWLGFKKPGFISIPLWLIRLSSRFGDLIPYSAINSTSYKLLMQNNIVAATEAEKFSAAIDFIPRDFATGIHSQPSSVQDHWHARLYFLKPLMRLGIAFIWIFTAICTLFLYPVSASYALLAKMGIHDLWQPITLYGSCLLDLLLGFAVLCHYQIKKCGLIQIVVCLFYMGLITWKLGYLWFDPLAPVAKNIPFLILILAYLALESDR
jgi:nucleoside-diphosphate-sugar epimerase